MMFWLLVGLMSVLALGFILLPILKPGMGRRPLLIAGLVLGLPLAAVLAYQKLGTPTAVTQPAMPSAMNSAAMPPGHPGANTMNMDLGQLADKLAEKLKANPNNADGWALLARTYVEIRRYKESLPAFEKATSMLPSDPHLLADYADALAMSNNGQFDKQSEGLVDKALALDPKHVKALMLKATIAFNRKDYPTAITNWETLLKVPGLDAERTKEAQGSIEEAKRLMGNGKS
jgi:cytochrome c-type biogenesis protein CcmH